jgi:hypothetical protein
MPQIYTTAAPIRLGSSNAPGCTGRMAVIGATSPLPCLSAKVPSPPDLQGNIGLAVPASRKLAFIEYNGGLSVHSSLLNVLLHD